MGGCILVVDDKAMLVNLVIRSLSLLMLLLLLLLLLLVWVLVEGMVGWNGFGMEL